MSAQSFVFVSLAAVALGCGATALGQTPGSGGSATDQCLAALKDAVSRIEALSRSVVTRSTVCPATTQPPGASAPPASAFSEIVLQEIRSALQPSVCQGSDAVLTLRPPNTVVVSGRLRQAGAASGALGQLKNRFVQLEFDLSDVEALGYCSVPLGDAFETVPGSGESRTAKLADVSEAMQANMFDDGECAQMGPQFASAVANAAEARRGFWVRRPQFDDLAICRAAAEGRWLTTTFNRNVQDAFILLRSRR